MLKEDLQKAVEEVKERIERYRTTYEGNEAMVSHQLVDPVLRALGWPTDDPDYVEYEERTEDGKPDWTLKWNEQKLFVETKSLDKDIRKSEIIRQLEGYLTGEGVEYGVITNGQRWLLFCVRPGTRREENILWQVDILEDPFDRVYRNLATIARENIDRIEDLIEKNKKMEEIWERLFNIDEPAPSVVEALAKVMRDNLPPEYQFEEEELKEFVETRIGGLKPSNEEPEPPTPSDETLPKTMSMPDRTVIYIRHGYDVLVETANWLIKKGKLPKIPYGRGRKRFLINTQPYHKDKSSFVSPKKLSNGMFIETNHSIQLAIKLAQKLMEDAGYGQNAIEFTF
jgi:predicted type IV restriction endonuclease